MPIPGSREATFHFDPMDVYRMMPFVYPSKGTFLSINKVQTADGQEAHTFTPIDDAHTLLPCRRSPYPTLRALLQERQLGDFQGSTAKFLVNFPLYIADANNQWQLQVDTVIYEIISVEWDGNNLSTRIGIGREIPYNA